MLSVKNLLMVFLKQQKYEESSKASVDNDAIGGKSWVILNDWVKIFALR